MMGVTTKLVISPLHINMLKQSQFTIKSMPKQAFGFTHMYFNNLLTKGEKHAHKMAWDERRFIVHNANEWINMMHSHLSYVPYLLLGVPAMSMLWGINYMLTLPYLPMLSGGILTFTNLTTTDPILPLITALTLGLHIRHHAMLPSLPLPPFKATPALLVPFLGSLFIMSHIPAAFHLYFIGSNIAGAAIGAVLNTQYVRTLINLQYGHDLFDRVAPQHHVFAELGAGMERNRQLLIQREKNKQIAAQAGQQITFTKVQSPTEQVVISEKSEQLEKQ